MAVDRSHRVNATGRGTAGRDRAINARAIVCPVCKAGVDDVCVRLDGSGETTVQHPARRRMAIRRENERMSYDAADVAYARDLTPRSRRLIREQTGVSGNELAMMVGLTRKTLWSYETETRDTSPSGPTGAAYGKWLREHAGPRR